MIAHDIAVSDYSSDKPMIAVDIRNDKRFSDLYNDRFMFFRASRHEVSSVVHLHHIILLIIIFIFYLYVVMQRRNVATTA
jgi:hypothetical protein